MPSVEPDPEIPYLEPLSDPNGDATNSDATDPSTTSTPSPLSPPPPFQHLPPEPACPSVLVQDTERGVVQFVRDATKSIKLSVVLENKGNVARDHLASERTYLAYVRTSLACASAGVALVQLLLLSAGSVPGQQAVDLTKFAKPVGATIVLFALIILGIGVFRYFATQSALVHGYFPVARHSITATSLGLGAMVIIVFAILLMETQ